MKNEWTERIKTLERELAECRAECEKQKNLIAWIDKIVCQNIKGGGEPNEAARKNRMEI